MITHAMRITAVLFIFLLSSCSHNANKVTEITFWAMGAEGEYVQKLVPEFEKRNPGIKVKVQSVPWTAAQEKLITAFAADNLPDGFQLGNTWIPQFTAIQAIEELNELVSQSNTVKPERYFAGIWETNVMNKKIMGIPWYVDTRVLFYRKDVMERAGYPLPPTTWEELLEVSRAIKKNAKGIDTYPIYIPTNEWPHFVIFGLQNGANMLKDNSSYGNFSAPEFLKAFDFAMQFYREDLTPPGLSQVTNIYDAFKKEYITMYISGPWNIIEFKKHMSGELADAWATAPLPGVNSYPGVSLAGGSSLVVNKKSKHKIEMWKFIEYLSEKSTQLTFFDLLYDLPAVKDAWDDERLRGNPYMAAFRTQFDFVVPTPKIAEWEQIVFSKLQQHAEVASKGIITNTEAMKRLDADADRILEKRRYLLSQSKLIGAE